MGPAEPALVQGQPFTLCFQAASSKPTQLPACLPHPATPRTEPLLSTHPTEHLASCSPSRSQASPLFRAVPPGCGELLRIRDCQPHPLQDR